MLVPEKTINAVIGNEYNNNMSYVIEFTSPVMKDKMYFHATRILVDRPEKATKYETKEEVNVFETFRQLSQIGYKDFYLTIEEI